MEIQALDLPQKYKDYYLKKGFQTLYPPQAECVERGLLAHKNLFISIPTASGKTFLAELAMLKTISKGKKAMYIVPLVALANEKFTSFRDFVPLGIKTGVAMGELSQSNDWLQGCDIIVCTAEKADSLMRSEAKWMDDVDCIVTDEVHLLADENRGPTLEMFLTKFREKNPGVQYISLSATVGNAAEVAEWLQSELVTTDWRPADLREGIFYKNKLLFDKYELEIPAITNDPSINVAIDTINNGGQCLIFESTRRNCSDFSGKLCAHVKNQLSPESIPELEKLASALMQSETNQLSSLLANSIRNGTAFHHAGLNSTQREIVESGFKKGLIKVIVCTPTLAAGLNLPARRVIIRNHQRFTPGKGIQNIPVLDYKQMAGRAGRPHLDPYGESVLIAHSKKDVKKLKNKFIDAEAELVLSNLTDKNNFETHLLATINNHFANSLTDIESFLRKTLYGFQNPGENFSNLAKKALAQLQHRHMVEVCNSIEATPFGKIVSVVYIYPETASIINEKIDNVFALTPFALMSIIASTPNMKRFNCNSAEKREIAKLIRDRKHELEWIKETEPEKLSAEDVSAVKTALVIMDWINGMPISEILTKHGITEGDLKTTISSAKWLVHATRKILQQQDNIWTSTVEDIEKTLEKGASIKVINLMKSVCVDRVIATELYNNGIQSLESLKETPLETVIDIVGFADATKIYDNLNIEYDLFQVLDRVRETKVTAEPAIAEPPVEIKVQEKIKPKTEELVTAAPVKVKKSLKGIVIDALKGLLGIKAESA